MKVWDLGGQANLRPSWQTYYKAAHAVIMVVDSTDRARVGIAKVSLHALHFVDIACALAKQGHVVLFLCSGESCPLKKDRVNCLQNELFSLLGHEHLSGAALLVLANKQDLKDAMRPAELSECLGLHTIKTHSYHIQSSCATTGEGLQEGLAWVAQKVHGQTK